MSPLLKASVALLALVATASLVVAEDATPVQPPTTVDDAYFLETFTDPLESRWVKSTHKDYTGNSALSQAVPAGVQGIPGDQSLVLTAASKRYGIAAPFAKETVPGKEIVFQYELKYAKALECGGTYLKFLTGSPKLAQLEEKTSYTVMFGPDKCGNTNKVHLIMRFKNAKTDEWKEHHLKDPPAIKNDELSHLYTAVLRPDNSFEIFIDQTSVRSGSLTADKDWELPFQPDKEIDDPSDKKPADWVDNEMYPDPAAKKPADWDEDAPQQIPDADAVKPAEWDDEAPAKIPDPAATKPDDWDEDEDGPWEAPIVDNPKCKTGCGEWKRPVKANPAYKGKWKAPEIKHPNYKGVWKAQKIANPGYYVVTDPVKDLAPIGAVAVEVWVHQPKGISFDNILVVDDLAKAQDFGAKTWLVRTTEEKRVKRERDEKARAADREKKLAEGDFWVSLEEYTKMGAEQFARYPWISFPALILLFWLIFKYFRPTKDPVTRETVRRTGQRRSVEKPKAGDKEVAKEETVLEDKKQEAGDLRKRAGKGQAEDAPKEESTDKAEDESAKDK